MVDNEIPVVKSAGAAVSKSCVPLIIPWRAVTPVVAVIIDIVSIGPTVYIKGVLSSSVFPGGVSILTFIGSIFVLNLGAR